MMEMLKQRAKIDLLHVPFRGAAPATQATVAGDTKVLFSGSASASLIQAGQLRAVATSGKKRAARFPDLPTIGEFYPGYAVDIWLGLFAPAGTPEPIVTTLRTEVHKLLSNAEFAKKLNVSGSLEPLVLSPADFSKLIHDDYEKYGHDRPPARHQDQLNARQYDAFALTGRQPWNSVLRNCFSFSERRDFAFSNAA